MRKRLITVSSGAPCLISSAGARLDENRHIFVGLLFELHQEHRRHASVVGLPADHVDECDDRRVDALSFSILVSIIHLLRNRHQTSWWPGHDLRAAALLYRPRLWGSAGCVRC